MGAILHPNHGLASSKVAQCGNCGGRDVYRSDLMPLIVQLEIDGRILAWLGGYVWDLGLFDDGVVHVWGCRHMHTLGLVGTPFHTCETLCTF